MKLLRKVARNLKGVARERTRGWVYTVRRGVATGLRRKGGLGFVPQIRPTPEQRFLTGRRLDGLVVYDVGAFEGTHSMFFGRAVGEDGLVVGFEPNPESIERARENLRLNGIENVRLLPVALGAGRARMQLAYDPSDRGRSRLGRRLQGHVRTAEVDVWPLDELIVAHSLPRPDFVKIDVEGAESDVLEGMKQTIARDHPALFVELHGEGDAEKLANVARLFTHLPARYRCWHVETSRPINPGETDLPRRGHLFCEFVGAPVDVGP